MVHGRLNDRLAAFGRCHRISIGAGLAARRLDLLHHRLGRAGIVAFTFDAGAGVVDDYLCTPGSKQ
jgi:hypothetical protein